MGRFREPQDLWRLPRLPEEQPRHTPCSDDQAVIPLGDVETEMYAHASALEARHGNSPRDLRRIARDAANSAAIYLDDIENACCGTDRRRRMDDALDVLERAAGAALASARHIERTLEDDDGDP